MSSFASGFVNSQEKHEPAPPSYAQIIEMDDIATAPLLHETFPGSIFGTATNLKFEWDSGYPDDYSFIIRDSTEYLQAKGKVTHLNTTLQNISGLEMLKIVKCSSSIEARPTFQVYNNNVGIGCVTFAKGEAAETCLKIYTGNADSQIVVRSLKLGDFAMFRDHLSTIPICNIHMPNDSVYASTEFNGTIMFLPETGITTQEQLLCTAASIVFNVSMKQVTKTAVSTTANTVTSTHTAAIAECPSEQFWLYYSGYVFFTLLFLILVLRMVA